MQAFEDLKQDVQALIDTAADTIQKLVDDAAAKAATYAGAPRTEPVIQPEAGSAEFIAQVNDLRDKVREATESLKTQAAAVLGNPAIGVNGGLGSTEPPIAVGSIGQVHTIGPDAFKAGA